MTFVLYMQELYAYVFSTGFKEDCFTLSVLHPRHDLLSSDVIPENLGVIVAEKRDDSPKVLEMLLTTQSPASEVSVHA